MWTRIKGAWAVLTGKAFATNYVTVKQLRYWECGKPMSPDLVDSMRYALEAYDYRNEQR